MDHLVVDRETRRSLVVDSLDSSGKVDLGCSLVVRKVAVEGSHLVAGTATLIYS